MLKGKLIGEVERWSEAGEYQPATVEAKELPSDGEQSVENDHGWLRTRGGKYGKYYDSRSGCLAEGDYATYFDNSLYIMWVLESKLERPAGT